jgi:hypothetical protein
MSRNAYWAVIFVLAFLGCIEITVFFQREYGPTQRAETNEQPMADALELLRLSIGCYGGLETGGFLTFEVIHGFSGDEQTFRTKTAFIQPSASQNSTMFVTLEAPWKAIDHVEVAGKELQVFCRDCILTGEQQNGEPKSKHESNVSEPAMKYRLCDAETAVNAADAMKIIGGVRFGTNQPPSN